jgi:membrane dipeptidase
LNSSPVTPLFGSGVVWDNHGCMPFKRLADWLPELERYRRAGVNVVSLNVGMAEMSWAEHVEVLSAMRHWIAQRPSCYRLISKTEDIRLCKAEATLGIVFDIEGMCPVQGNLNFIQTFYELGVRWMLIAYNRNNLAGGGCLEVDPGLSNVGRQIIDEMERVGMVLCLSHTGARTAGEAIEYARNPTIFSHSNPYTSFAHPRNISDSVMRSCASKGGVIGISGIGPYLGAKGNLIEVLLKHVLHTVDCVGAAHVGLGLDYVFDQSELIDAVRRNPTLYPSGLVSDGGLPMVAPESVQAIAEGLAKRNFTDAQVRGVLGENWLRVASTVWR